MRSARPIGAGGQMSAMMSSRERQKSDGAKCPVTSILVYVPYTLYTGVCSSRIYPTPSATTGSILCNPHPLRRSSIVMSLAQWSAVCCNVAVFLTSVTYTRTCYNHDSVIDKQTATVQPRANTPADADCKCYSASSDGSHRSRRA